MVNPCYMFNPFFQIHFAIFAKPFRQPFFWALGKLEPPFRVDRASAGQVRGGHATPLLLGAATRWARLGRRASEPGSHHVLSHVPFLSDPILSFGVEFQALPLVLWNLLIPMSCKSIRLYPICIASPLSCRPHPHFM